MRVEPVLNILNFLKTQVEEQTFCVCLLLYSNPELALWMCLSALQQVWLNGHPCLLWLREWFLEKQIRSQIICPSSHHPLGKKKTNKTSSRWSAACVFWVHHLLEWYPFWCEHRLGQTVHQPSADAERKPKCYFSMYQDRTPPGAELAKMERECCTLMLLLCLERILLLDQCFAFSSLA